MSADLPPVSELNPLILVCGSLAIATVNSHQHLANQTRELVKIVVANRADPNKADTRLEFNCCEQIEIFTARWTLMQAFHMCLYTFLAVVMAVALAKLMAGALPSAVTVSTVAVISGVRIYELYLGQKTFQLAVKQAIAPTPEDYKPDH